LSWEGNYKITLLLYLELPKSSLQINPQNPKTPKPLAMFNNTRIIFIVMECSTFGKKAGKEELLKIAEEETEAYLYSDSLQPNIKKTLSNERRKSLGL
jgi:hypothetical protein